MQFINAIILSTAVVIVSAGILKANTVPSSGTLIIHVSIGDTGKPLPGAAITVRSDSATITGTTNTYGQCIIASLKPGKYSVKIKSKGFEERTITINITGGQASLHDINLHSELVYTVHAHALVINTKSSSSSTEISQKTVSALSGSDNLSKLLYTVPGAAQGPFGEVHFRGAHTEITYRIDGVSIPSAVSGSFSDILDPQDIQSIDVMTGGYPAEYGNSLAGVVNITTRQHPEKEIGIKEGNFNTHSINFNVSGSKSAFTYSLSGISYFTGRGLDTPVVNPIHDNLLKHSLFGNFSYMIDNNNWVSVLLYGDISQYQIPNTDLQQALVVNDNQNESNDYETILWHHNFKSDSNLIVSAYRRGSTLGYDGSPADLYGGTLTSPAYLNNVAESFLGSGAQANYTNNVIKHNQIKAGISYKYLINKQGFFLAESPQSYPPFFDNHTDSGFEYSGYAQDELHYDPVTVNAGLRYDYINEYVTADQLSPRIGIAVKLFKTNSIHAYYGRFFQPAPFENIHVNSIPMFANQNMSIPLQPERDNYFEVGDQQMITDYLLAKLTWYYKLMTNVIDYNQLLNSNIYVPYNIQSGYTRGIEFSIKSREVDGLSGEFNIAWERSQGKGAITGGLFTVEPVPQGYFYFDHDQTYTSSALISYRNHGFWSMLDLEYGSGLPYGYNAVTGDVNYLRVPPHTIAGLNLGYNFEKGFYLGKSDIELDIGNILNTSYLINQQNGFNNTHWGSPRTIAILFKKYL
ncbi:MAG: TonB-dependent receptor [Deltaproteobacteria bacterium]|nr:TonB-dependent receptor [Deltaproteobacteria bacterium]